MKTIPYLNFDGNCAEAFRFYAEVLGGELSLLTHEEAPMEMDAGWEGKILNAHLVSGDAEIMGSDLPPGSATKPQGMYVSLHVDSRTDAERIYGVLAEGGRVSMPLDRTFWAERFGMLVDRFGTPWMINFEGSEG
jgi:PhnB protein